MFNTIALLEKILQSTEKNLTAFCHHDDYAWFYVMMIWASIFRLWTFFHFSLLEFDWCVLWLWFFQWCKALCQDNLSDTLSKFVNPTTNFYSSLKKQFNPKYEVLTEYSNLIFTFIFPKSQILYKKSKIRRFYPLNHPSPVRHRKKSI